MVLALNQLLPSTTDDLVLTPLPFNEIVRFSRVSQDARDKVLSYMRRHFNLAITILPWIPLQRFPDFLSLMARTQMILSGSVALQFFTRVCWPDSDLDLYLPPEYALEVVAWLSSLGYVFVPHGRAPLTLPDLLAGPTDPPTTSALECEPSQILGYVDTMNVINFSHSETHRNIQIITCPGTPVQGILKFHSTLAVNFITHERAYCVYPKATLVKSIGLVQPFVIGSKFAEALEKYQQRGWEIIHLLPKALAFGPQALFPFGLRHFDDGQTFSLPVAGELVLPSDHIKVNSWILSYNTNMHPSIDAIHVKSLRLQQSYILSPQTPESELQELFFEICERNTEKRFLDQEFGAAIRTQHN